MNYQNQPQASGVYQIKNLNDGKIYVGSAKNLRTRARKHSSALRLNKHHNRHLQSAYNRYGNEAFEVSTLLICRGEDLLFYEQRALDTTKNKYNHAPVAGNTLGVVCTQERKDKISEAHTGKKLSEEHKKAIAESGVGRKPSADTLAKLKERAKQRAKDPEWRSKVSKGKLGKKLSRAHRKAISESKKGKPTPLTEEGRRRKSKKIAEANRTRPISDAHRKNASESGKKRKGIPKHLYAGEHYSLLELTELSGLSRTCLRHRLVNLKWSVARAVETPSRKAGPLR